MSMATFVLIHGAGDVGWYWHLVEAELHARGHDTLAPDLPCEDDSAGLPEYASTVVDAIGDRQHLVVVGQSLAGFTAPIVCKQVAVDLVVLLAPMIPAPGDSPVSYWTSTGYDSEDRQHYDDTIDIFYQDVPEALAAEAMSKARTQSEARMGEPWPLDAWPSVPTRVILCRDDHLFPPRFIRRVAQQRLGITPDEIDGGHCPALSRPKDLADMLDSYTSAVSG
jgi:pimeloyl-ACP methyl ester carboxylesterase